MGAVETKTFKIGNSVAMQLPAELGIASGTNLQIERVGTHLRIILPDEEAERLARFRRVIDTLEAIGPLLLDPSESREEERIEFPDRPGLY